MKAIFWISLILLIYVYAGYPALLTLLALLTKRPVDKGEMTPTVSIIIPAYNEEAVIEEKLKNVLALDYPRDKLEIIIASDGSTDKTADIVSKRLQEGIKLLAFPQRRGKPEVLNEVVPQAKGEIIVFSDASSILEKDAIRKLVRNFEDGEVGCVCGDYKFGYADASLRGKGESLFVKYELFLKKKEAEMGSLLGLHGAIYAIRKGLYQNLPLKAINDDYITSARIVERGFRSVFETEAIAYERQNVTAKNEFRRRARIAAGNWQQLSHLKSLFNPLRGMIFIEFLSHKVLRTMTPILLLILLIANFFLPEGVYKIIFLAQIIFYLTAMAGFLLEKRKVYLKLFYVPFYFCFSNLAVGVGFFKFLTGRQEVKWKR